MRMEDRKKNAPAEAGALEKDYASNTLVSLGGSREPYT